MSILPTVIVSLLTFILLLRFLIFPVLFRALTNFRVSSRPSLRSRLIIWNGGRLPRRMREFQPYGIEWLRWAWGGLSGDAVELVVLRLDGVSFRIREKPNWSGHMLMSEKGQRYVHAFISDLGKQRRSQFQLPGRMTSTRPGSSARCCTSSSHHCPGIARLVSIQIADIRLIFDDLAGLELTVRNFRLGVKVDFESDGSVDGGPLVSPSLKPPGFSHQRPVN